MFGNYKYIYLIVCLSAWGGPKTETNAPTTFVWGGSKLAPTLDMGGPHPRCPTLFRGGIKEMEGWGTD